MAGGTAEVVVGDALLEGSVLCQSRDTPEGTMGHRQPTPEQGHHRRTVSHSTPMLEWRKTSKKQEAVHTSLVSCIAPHQRDQE